jgi:hypothetical protein
MQREVYSEMINLFDETIVYSPDKDWFLFCHPVGRYIDLKNQKF